MPTARPLAEGEPGTICIELIMFYLSCLSFGGLCVFGRGGGGGGEGF